MKSPHEMSKDELIATLFEAQIKIKTLRIQLNKERIINETHSRFTNPDYIASFC